MLTIENLCVTFNRGTENEKKALKNINLTVNEGDFITVIGSNGAGKSTLLNSIFGLIHPQKGHITLNDICLDKMKSYERSRQMGILFQDPTKGTAPNMTIYENLNIALGKGKHKEEITELVKKLDMGLETRLKTNVGLLSGGQRQAITLLMATSSNPSLLLLDEHTAALDPQTSKKIMELTTSIVEEHKLSTIMITHNIQSAIDVGNRLIFMKDGEIIKEYKGEEKKNLTVGEVMEFYKNTLADSMVL